MQLDGFNIGDEVWITHDYHREPWIIEEVKATSTAFTWFNLTDNKGRRTSAFSGQLRHFDERKKTKGDNSEESHFNFR